MGIVWAAKHVLTEKRVALKILKVPGTDVRRRFLREARLAAAIRHPNVVDVHDVLELETGEPFMVMDLLEGESLSETLERRRTLALDEVARIFLPVISAVSAAHAMGVVHRDLKPENIFLARADGEDQVKVLDFGIAKVTAAQGALKHTTGLTQTGSVLGTPTYMAPEQVFGEKTIDHRADVWALGVILYECLSGTCPIEGENVGQIFKSISQHNFPPLASRSKSVPRDVATMVDQMLALDAGARPTLLAVGEVLARESSRSLPTILAPASELSGSPSDPPSTNAKRHTPTSSATTIAAQLRPSRGRYAIALVAAAFVVVGYTLWRATPATPIATRLPVEAATAPPAVAASTLPTDPLVVDHAPEATPKPSASGSSSLPLVSSARTAPPSLERSAPSAGAKSADPPRSSDPRALGGVHVGSPY